MWVIRKDPSNLRLISLAVIGLDVVAVVSFNYIYILKYTMVINHNLAKYVHNYATGYLQEIIYQQNLVDIEFYPKTRIIDTSTHI